MIEVLWIDDECMTSLNKLSAMGQEFVEFAYENGINITPKLTYKEGIDAIKNNPLKWCAVILDIHNQKATTENPYDDYFKAKEEIIRFQTESHQEEPYIFVLSGNKQTKDFPEIKRDYCSKRIYDKNNEGYKALFEDIKKIKEISPLYHCICKYKDVLESAKTACGEDTWKRMVELLYKIDIKGVNNVPSLFNDMRKILEDIKKGLKECNYSFFTKDNGKMSLNDLSRYVGKDPDVPVYIQRALHTLTSVVQDGSHSDSQNNKNKLKVDHDVSKSKAPYLLKSSLYELCNVLIWMGTLV